MREIHVSLESKPLQGHKEGPRMRIEKLCRVGDILVDNGGMGAQHNVAGMP